MEIKRLLNQLAAVLSGRYKDGTRVTGTLKLELYDASGKLKSVREIPNLVVTVGLQHVADQMSDQGEGAMSHMAVGTDNTAAAAGDTTLNTELARVALTSVTQSTVTVVYVGTFPAGTGTGALVEAGILNAGGGGVLLCRTVYSVVNKGAADSLVITWTITFSAV